MNATYAFLESELTPSPADEADVYVLPVPLERTVSYGAGTDKGPEAILAASQQLEAAVLQDGRSQPRIHTAAPIDVSGPPEAVLDRVCETVQRALKQDAVPLLLGGEHTVTYGAALALHRTLGEDVGVVQFDAHADLRHSYEGTPWSHACVMRRVLDLGLPICQIGVRSLCAEDHQLRHDLQIPHLDARSLWEKGVPDDILPPSFPRRLYITFDVDAFDASLMPATGTPEPGGLLWWQACALIDRALKGRTLVGADVVELAPIPTLHHCNYTAAKLAYHLIQSIR